MGESFQSMGNLSKKHGDERNIVGDCGVDISRGGEEKICEEVLSWSVF